MTALRPASSDSRGEPGNTRPLKNETANGAASNDGFYSASFQPHLWGNGWCVERVCAAPLKVMPCHNLSASVSVCQRGIHSGLFGRPGKDEVRRRECFFWEREDEGYLLDVCLW